MSELVSYVLILALIVVAVAIWVLSLSDVISAVFGRQSLLLSFPYS